MSGSRPAEEQPPATLVRSSEIQPEWHEHVKSWLSTAALSKRPSVVTFSSFNTP